MLLCHTLQKKNTSFEYYYRFSHHSWQAIFWFKNNPRLNVSQKELLLVWAWADKEDKYFRFLLFQLILRTSQVDKQGLTQKWQIRRT
jgi:hypothetical protein